MWGISSADRAHHSHWWGQGFESLMLHHILRSAKSDLFYFLYIWYTTDKTGSTLGGELYAYEVNRKCGSIKKKPKQPQVHANRLPL